MAEELGQHIQKHELSGPKGGPLELQNLSDEELDAHIAELTQKLEKERNR